MRSLCSPKKWRMDCGAGGGRREVVCGLVLSAKMNVRVVGGEGGEGRRKDEETTNRIQLRTRRGRC